ncbi:MAG TPA: hypothetical protein ENH10_08255 [Bacteroidetes bacterium]|nr:hypothetical protein [Bacteroidota bacterium]HEX05128.1 hypothetical protein [Bacteroidota bacterium]
MEILLHHEFPGNVRELENIIEFGFAICRGRTLKIEHLPVDLRDARSQASSTGDLPRPDQSSDHSKSSIVDEQPIRALMKQFAGDHVTPVRAALVEEAAIREALRMYKNNRTKAAKALGIDRTTLWRKMKKYEMRDDSTSEDF